MGAGRSGLFSGRSGAGPLRGQSSQAPHVLSAHSRSAPSRAPLRTPEPALVPAAPQGFPWPHLPGASCRSPATPSVLLTGTCPWWGASAFRVAAEAACPLHGRSRHGPDGGCVFRLLLVCELGLGPLGNGVAVPTVCVGRVLGTPGPVTLEAPPVPLNMGTQAGKAQTGASAVTVCVSRVGQMFRPVADTGESSVSCDRGGTKPCSPHTPAGSRGAFPP